MTSAQLYLPTTKQVKINLKPRYINSNLDLNIRREIEKQYGNKLFSIGYIRPGSIRIISRSLGHKKGVSDFSGSMLFDVEFECEVYLPQRNQEIEIRVNSKNKIGILGQSDNNKLTVLLYKNHQQTAPELFSQVIIGNRLIIKILELKIDSHQNTIIIIGDLMRILSGVYQYYQIPQMDNIADFNAEFEFTPNINTLYPNYTDFVKSVNFKSSIDPYYLERPKNMYNKQWWETLQSPPWKHFKHYWLTAKSLVEDYELIYPTASYNKNKGIAQTPFGSQPINRAYFKMWEMLYRVPDIIDKLPNQNLTILALAEGPGGFMQAISHYLMQLGLPSPIFYGYTIETESGHLRWDYAHAVNQRKKLQGKFNLAYGDLTLSKTISKIYKESEAADLIVAHDAIESIGNTNNNYK